jgi:hypothetical protein
MAALTLTRARTTVVVGADTHGGAGALGLVGLESETGGLAMVLALEMGDWVVQSSSAHGRTGRITGILDERATVFWPADSPEISQISNAITTVHHVGELARARRPLCDVSPTGELGEDARTG